MIQEINELKTENSDLKVKILLSKNKMNFPKTYINTK